jgi:GAF domain-containing protein
MTTAPDLPGLAGPLAEHTRKAVGSDDLDIAVGLVMELAMDADICDHASVTERGPDGTLVTTAPSDELVVTADKMQYVLHEGPCVAAAYDDQLLTSTDVAADPRWPHWGPQAATLGIRSVMSVHLYTDKDAMGALNLYSTRRRDYQDSDKDLARLIGAHVSVALAYFRGQAHLWRAIDARHSIGVAQGILMQQYGIDDEKAYALLLRASQAENVRLHLVAARVVRTGRVQLTASDPLEHL